MKYYVITIIALLLCIASCSKYDDYLKYVEGGEIVYPQKPDSVKAFAGKKRVGLQWLTLDPRITGFAIEYGYAGNFQTADLPVNHSGSYNVDTIKTTIENLDESSYTFRISSYDEAGNKSLVVEIDESSYAENYEKGLLNRLLKSCKAEGAKVTFEWYDAAASEIGVEIQYRATGGATKTVMTLAGVNTTVINDFSVSQAATYRTVYKPTETAIDFFYAAEQTVAPQ
jgi:hypothetical protein